MGFLILFFPYTVTLLINGRQGMNREEQLPSLEYQVLCRLMKEDYSWMEDGTLELMAILYRTDCVREQEASVQELPAFELYGDAYDRAYQAVLHTKGQVITIDGEYRELPYHAVSAGITRDSALLGEEYAYVNSVECPRDKESDSYLQICYLTAQESKSWAGENFRSLLHLASSCFWIESEQDSIRIVTRGSGHGFGISLYTANCMAQEGAGVSEIIQKFYQNAECITIP